jgi:c-di-GMP-binding flagellar brake protein YcgR
MINAKGLKERRKQKRFQGPKGLFVGVGPENTKVGRVSDLSIGGLGFSYVGTEEPSKGSYLDLFFTDQDFYLSRLRFKSISDYELVEKEPSSSETLRRCGVKFEKVTRHQKAEIERFIQNYTMGEA